MKTNVAVNYYNVTPARINSLIKKHGLEMDTTLDGMFSWVKGYICNEGIRNKAPDDGDYVLVTWYLQPN